MSNTTEQKTVFIVTRGEYSDYRIDSVWTAREDAEAELAKAVGYGYDGTVEEWPVDAGGKTYHTYYVARLSAPGPGIVIDKEPTSSEVPRKTSVNLTDGKFWRGVGFGPTPEHARKSLSDALAKAKAELLESGTNG